MRILRLIKFGYTANLIKRNLFVLMLSSFIYKGYVRNTDEIVEPIGEKLEV